MNTTIKHGETIFTGRVADLSRVPLAQVVRRAETSARPTADPSFNSSI